MHVTKENSRFSCLLSRLDLETKELSQESGAKSRFRPNVESLESSRDVDDKKSLVILIFFLVIFF